MTNSKSVRETVADRLAATGIPSVTGKVVDVLVERELERRVKLVLEALEKRDVLVTEGRKIKPDVVSYDTNGATFSEAWSKAKLDERNKNQQQLEKLEAAIELALEKGDFTKLS